MVVRRKHHKVAMLPPVLLELVNEKLVAGHTYEEISAWLKQMGEEVSKSAVGRYGKDFNTRLERLKLVREQAKAIIDSNQGEPATHLAEATNELALSMIMETLQNLDNLQGQKVTELLKVLPKLADASTRREALKLQFNKGVETAAARIKESLKGELAANPELQQRMMELVEKAKAEIAG
ncbi:phage protein Gp27 family protein [Pelotomaculum propionicicum]|uniref:DUF3486 family protein n=1 Tax=Pelotomaculum propionicicum TaxID=258475 RepID=A0A4Y7RK07_9FIRM|nr:phage protein Gp27 family protein [Pelotomaculum propionicicum]TEB09315.1 hypothetical protein Pmgp_03247 [Pelotomaculum propionicicum]